VILRFQTSEKEGGDDMNADAMTGRDGAIDFAIKTEHAGWHTRQAGSTSKGEAQADKL
jgi:hypothetical protein